MDAGQAQLDVLSLQFPRQLLQCIGGSHVHLPGPLEIQEHGLGCWGALELDAEYLAQSSPVSTIAIEGSGHLSLSGHWIAHSPRNIESDQYNDYDSDDGDKQRYAQSSAQYCQHDENSSPENTYQSLGTT